MTVSSRRLALRLLLAAPLAALAGCGRKADPIPPPGADPRAPRVYPVDRSRPPEERPRQDDIRRPLPSDPSVPAPPPPPPPPLSPLEYPR